MELQKVQEDLPEPGAQGSPSVFFSNSNHTMNEHHHDISLQSSNSKLYTSLPAPELAVGISPGNSSSWDAKWNGELWKLTLKSCSILCPILFCALDWQSCAVTAIHPLHKLVFNSLIRNIIYLKFCHCLYIIQWFLLEHFQLFNPHPNPVLEHCYHRKQFPQTCLQSSLLSPQAPGNRSSAACI